MWISLHEKRSKRLGAEARAHPCLQEAESGVYWELGSLIDQKRSYEKKGLDKFVAVSKFINEGHLIAWALQLIQNQAQYTCNNRLFYVNERSRPQVSAENSKQIFRKITNKTVECLYAGKEQAFFQRFLCVLLSFYRFVRKKNKTIFIKA